MTDPAPRPDRHELVVFGIIAFAALVGALIMAFESSLFGPGEPIDPVEPVTQVVPVEADDVAATDIDAPVVVEDADPGEREEVLPDQVVEPVDEVALDLPETSLKVRVVDGDGAPVAGVALEWVREFTTGDFDEGRVEGADDGRPRHARDRTNGEGLLAVADGDRFFDALFDPQQVTNPLRTMTRRIGLRATMPFDEYEGGDEGEDETRPWTVWLDAAPDPEVPVEVVLPPFGWVEFTWDPVVDAFGDEVEMFHLHVRRSDDGHFPGWRWGEWLEDGGTAYRFGPVGLGWEVYGAVSMDEMSGPLGVVYAPGPVREGQTVQVEVPVAETAASLVGLRGRVLREDGSPAGYERQTLRFGDPEEGYGTSFVTRKDGTFRAQVTREHVQPLVTVEPQMSDRREVAYTKLEPAVISAPETRVLDLGDLVLIPGLPEKSMIVAGRVTDTTGAPIVGATVRVQAFATSQDGRQINDPGRLTLLGYARTDVDGAYAFEALVEIPNGELHVTPSSRDHVPAETRQVAVGNAAVDFELRQGASVTLDLELDPWGVMHDPIALSFEGEGRRFNPSLMDFFGHYDQRFGGLEPGRYTLQIVLRGGAWVLHESTVDVGSLGTIDLGTIDLRGALGAVHLRALDGNGSQVREESLALYDADTGVQVEASVRTDGTGRLTAIVPTGAGDLILRRRTGGSGAVLATWFTTLDTEAAPEFQPVVLLR